MCDACVMHVIHMAAHVILMVRQAHVVWSCHVMRRMAQAHRTRYTTTRTHRHVHTRGWLAATCVETAACYVRCMSCCVAYVFRCVRVCTCTRCVWC